MLRKMKAIPSHLLGPASFKQDQTRLVSTPVSIKMMIKASKKGKVPQKKAPSGLASRGHYFYAIQMILKTATIH